PSLGDLRDCFNLEFFGELGMGHRSLLDSILGNKVSTILGAIHRMQREGQSKLFILVGMKQNLFTS
ncbi:hypothetical protein, partial [Cohaesibacter haloalkalitolerans]|uniref:hypothetical protein n=1 Tax=Cohaesibacter haloalkalitolerans TaxID=1162980 RepID=UPI001969063E